jgi:hypothetical protein
LFISFSFFLSCVSSSSCSPFLLLALLLTLSSPSFHFLLLFLPFNDLTHTTVRPESAGDIKQSRINTVCSLHTSCSVKLM